MKLIGHKFWDSVWLGRALLLVLGLSLILGGLSALASNRLHYRNYWGGVVFAPLAIAMGAGALIYLVLKWRTLDERGERLRGKAARKARQAERARPAVETFDDPWTSGGA